ncbi:hypothetical protein [Rhodococcus ruber]
MQTVTDLEWLQAVSEHPSINLDDVAVAAALVLSDATSAADVLGVQPRDVSDIDGLVCDLVIRRLEAIGALVPEVQAGNETIYELRIP